jgi:hypothetical protein
MVKGKQFINVVSARTSDGKILMGCSVATSKKCLHHKKSIGAIFKICKKKLVA